ncbi:flagellar hook assembly protein FlgD [Thiohalophilus sp.]|uniref:flagellar hook assembly protein FlgD n=1 Tax=Thiohalophilus sp. TaxID=3028392 RepID=UPI002ACDCC57|nr:flagellar hook assembly protein FlgD [Thiohalophilus sp.]MDZ7802616.1 flagellar hook assembly protein FlgD [Thiohalophilus sp.]
MDSINKGNATSFESLGLTQPKKPAPGQANGNADTGSQISGKQSDLGQEDFMKLMLTKMNQQDPFKPMEDGEFLSQMAQFSAVSGLKDIKESFSTLSDSLKSNHALQASSMVGRKVMIPGDKAVLPEGGELKGAVDLPTSTGDLKISFYDASGELAHTINKGSQNQGMVNFSWDGKAGASDAGENPSLAQQNPAGTYTVKAEMVVDGKTQSVDPMVMDNVESVSIGKQGQGITLNLANAGSKSMSDVREIM